ncbi:MAG: molecular chaperone HtpG [Deltaproteobacteria bacterium]|nr:molecular chaperone HtpG [Candidatus Anaeroferrophillacea bacterium]
MTTETREFQTEIKQLLHLMINSLYSHPEIFLRELISNASDAIDKLRFRAQTEQHLLADGEEPEIRLDVDPEKRILSVSDNGVGMTREEVVEQIGTIAKSGTRQFTEALSRREGGAVPPELIGQFGVGFYSSFMVADRVELVTRAAGTDAAVRWESDGSGSYTIGAAERPRPGTTVILHLREPGEDGQDFTREWTLRAIVKKYSDFVTYPVRLEVEREETPTTADGKPIEGAKPEKKRRVETLNSMKPLWNKRAAEVKAEEYREFYHHLSHDWGEPLETVHVNAEGMTEYNAIMFIPARAGFELFMPDRKSAMQLYVKRVFITDNCEELMPPYLRFVRGVVDSADLSLNISREMLQHDRRVLLIKKNLVKKLLDTFAAMLEQEREKYLTFWEQFGPVLKEGMHYDAEQREKLQDLLLFASTAGGDLTTLKEYVARMPEGQKEIYYVTGEERAALARAPHLEALKAKGFEVLLMTDPVDEWVLQGLTSYDEKPLKSAAKGDFSVAGEDEGEDAKKEREAASERFKPLLKWLGEQLGGQVKEVRVSSRLTDSPVCLVADEYDLSPAMERLLKASGQEVPERKRIMEVNPGHDLLQLLRARYVDNPSDPLLPEYARLLLDQALLTEGSSPVDPVEFGRRVARLMVEAAQR